MRTRRQLVLRWTFVGVLCVIAASLPVPHWLKFALCVIAAIFVDPMGGFERRDVPPPHVHGYRDITIEHAPVEDDQHTTFMVSFCTCGDVLVFPRDNYLLTTDEFRTEQLPDWLRGHGMTGPMTVRYE